MKKRILSIITALAVVIALLPAAAAPASAAGTGRTVSVSDSDTFNNAIADLRDGDTIQLTNSFVVTTPTSSNDSLFIGKNVTIDGQGYQLTLRYAGVLLGADVTFKNVSLGLASNVRPAIMANGHTLILEGVTRAESCRNINLFCGGQTGATQGDLSAQNQGLHGQIIIKGNTYLGPTGRIFAGSISTDGTNNEFTLPATVTIEENVTGDAIGELYACGALETYTSTDDLFDYQNEINPPFASPGNFKVREQVTFNLYQSKVRKVSGDTGIEGNLAQVNYKGTNYLNDNLVLSSIGGLTVESGNLAPAAGQLEQKNASATDRTSEIVSVSGGSCFSSTNNALLSIASGATLGLQKLGDVTVGNFTGGGFLILHQNQTLSISGAVTGTASVAVGGVSYNSLNSTTLPVEGHTYITARNSQDGAFVLLPYSTRPDMKLVRDGSGNWTVPAQTVGTSKLQSLAPADTRVESGETEILVPLKSTYSGDGLYIEDIPLTIWVNGAKASFNTDEYGEYYEAAGLHLYAGYYGSGEKLAINAATFFADPIPDGRYIIEIVVPGTCTVSGADLTASFTLTVGDAPPEPVSIPIPQAISGLIWTGAEQTGVNEGTGYTLIGHRATAVGSYTATATLASGYRWEDGTTDPKSIPWVIARAAAPAAPTGLSGVAPTSTGGTDGKITGTTAGMEYSAGNDFSNSQTCGAGETAGLAAGTYYVRVKGDNNRMPGEMAQVTVPAYEEPTPGHQHSWSGEWSTSATHHWHNCTRENCPIQEESGKNGYAAHVPGEWVTDKAPTATESGSRHRSCTVCGYEMARETLPATGPVPGEHQHSWSGEWSASATHHWHNCTRENCPIQEESQKNGYAAHVPGGWVMDKTPTATESGSRHRSCTVCSYETARETLPATGGGSSGGGSTGGSGSTGGGNYTGGGSATTTETTRNPDGSTTTTVTNKTTGTVTETTRDADGSTKVVETKRDGTVTTTDTARNGVKVVTVSKPGADTSARVTLPASVRTATVILPGAATPGTVAVDAKTGKAVKLSAPNGSGMAVKLDGSAELVLEDRSKAFTDTDGHWAESAIDFVTARALFSGTSDAAFSPNEPMTRGMAAVVLHNFEGNPGSSVQGSFTDVASGTWYTDAVHWATAKGITGGYGNGSFGANDYVTREQLVTFLYRYADAMGYSTQGGADLSAFSDGASVSAYAAEAMRWAVGNGLIVGTDNGVLAPGSNATRAQAACILNRFVLSLMK